MKNDIKLHFTYDKKNPQADSLYQKLIKMYKDFPPTSATHIAVLGGDGFLLQTLHKHLHSPLPIYGINLGHTGFLLNNITEYKNLKQKVLNAIEIKIKALEFTAVSNGKKISGYAFNEIVLQRQNYQTAHIKITIDGKERIDDLICDGLLVATPSGSAGYNRAAGGEILPLQTHALTLTAICPSYPRGFKGAICPADSQFKFEILQSEKRPVSLTTDVKTYLNVSNISVKESKKITKTILFDNQNSLDEKIISAQFMNFNFSCKV